MSKPHPWRKSSLTPKSSRRVREDGSAAKKMAELLAATDPYRVPEQLELPHTGREVRK